MIIEKIWKRTIKPKAKRPVFDLKASLARPLTWTPHHGKLKPSSVGWGDVKDVKLKTRDERLVEVKANRIAHCQAAAMH